MFQNFQLSITHLHDNRYFLRTEHATPGVPNAEEQVEWDVEHWLAEAQNLMSDPLSRLLQGTGRLSAQNRLVTPETDLMGLSMEEVPAVATTLMEFGQKLYTELFTGSLKESWSKAQAIAHNQNQILRVRLGCKEQRLLNLPWEVLNYIGSQDGDIESLTTGIETSFSRYNSKTQNTTDTEASMDEVQEQTLKILMVLASPTDQDSLELKTEAAHLQEELDKETTLGTPPLELTILDNPGRQQLTEILEQGQYQVFHYAGHSNLGQSGGDIYLVNSETGLTEAFAGDDLAGLLVNNGVQLAIFNSCHGAEGIANFQPEENNEKSLTQALVRRGIPAVLGMSAQIPDQVALTFTRLLYRNLHQGYPIDFSLGRARQGLISAYGSHQLYWALPVLYMHPQFNGLLQHRSLNREGLAELLHISDLEPVALSEEDEERLAIASPAQSDDSFWLEESDEDLFSPPSGESLGSTEETAFIKNVLAEISSDLQEIKQEKSKTPKTPAAPSGLVVQPPVPFSKVLSRYRQQIAIGIGLAIAIGGGLWLLQSQRKLEVPIATETLNSQQTIDLSKLNNDMILTLARNNPNDWPLLKRIATHLLNQQSLPQAKQVIHDIATPNSVNTAELNFLKGRHAWQTILKGDPSENTTLSAFDDVRRFWGAAAEANDQEPYYLHAMAFAYYAEGKYNEASEAWTEVINVAESRENFQLAAHGYAGLAIALHKNAQTQPAETRENWESKTIKLREKAFSLDSKAVELNTLGQEWLWSEQAIADWQYLIN